MNSRTPTPARSTTQTLAGKLGSFVAACRYEDLTAPTVEALKLRILDTLGAGMAGAGLSNHAALMPLLQAGESPVWGTPQLVSMRDAVLANSFLVHSTYLEDGSRYTGGHPSSAVIPAALAVAHAYAKSGRALLAAVASGYEIFLRLGRVLYPAIVKKGFQSTAVLGSIASAGAAANLLGLRAEQCEDALAIASMLGIGLKAALDEPESQPLQVGRACEGGAVAALFAANGAKGAPRILEDGFLPAFGSAPLSDELARLGSEFSVDETYLKIHGGCRGNHAPTDAMLRICSEHRVQPAAIDRVRIDVDSVTHAADVAYPDTGKQAQFSIRFSVASVLLNGDASIFRFTDEQVLSEPVRGLMARIDVRSDPQLDRDYPNKRGARIELSLADGRRLVGAIDNARGEPEHPLSQRDIERKFLSLASSRLGPCTQEVLETIMNLDAQSDVRPLVACLGGSRQETDQCTPRPEEIR